MTLPFLTLLRSSVRTLRRLRIALVAGGCTAAAMFALRELT
jgi:hypothetical protein